MTQQADSAIRINYNLIDTKVEAKNSEVRGKSRQIKKLKFKYSDEFEIKLKYYPTEFDTFRFPLICGSFISNQINSITNNKNV